MSRRDKLETAVPVGKLQQIHAGNGRTDKAPNSAFIGGGYKQVHIQVPTQLYYPLVKRLKKLGYVNVSEWVREIARNLVGESAPDSDENGLLKSRAK